jgi:hypothetical protein
MHLSQQRRTEPLDKLIEAEGFATVEAMLEGCGLARRMIVA